jgi:acyl-CoA thioester hydrolase
MLAKDTKMSYIFELNMKVRDYECDMQGIVNNAVYMSYLEHARHEFLESRGVTFRSLVEKDIIVMVSNMEIAFKASLRSGDLFVVKINAVKKYANLILQQDIFNTRNDQLCVMAKVKLVCKVNGKLTRGELFDQFIN